MAKRDAPTLIPPMSLMSLEINLARALCSTHGTSVVDEVVSHHGMVLVDAVVPCARNKPVHQIRDSFDRQKNQKNRMGKNRLSTHIPIPRIHSGGWRHRQIGACAQKVTCGFQNFSDLDQMGSESEANGNNQKPAKFQI